MMSSCLGRFGVILLLSLACACYRMIPRRYTASATKSACLHYIGLRSSSQGNTPQNQIRTAQWAKVRGLVPGYGGYWPGNPDAKRYNVTITTSRSAVSVSLLVPEDRYIFFYFEEQGIDLPIVNKAQMCRQGCCTTCCGKLASGKVKMDAPLGLLKESRDAGNVLTCCSYPKSDLVINLQDEDEAYIRQWADGFEGGGVQWGGFLPDDD